MRPNSEVSGGPAACRAAARGEFLAAELLFLTQLRLLEQNWSEVSEGRRWLQRKGLQLGTAPARVL